MVGKVAIFEEVVAVFEVDNGSFWSDSGRFGFGCEFDKGIMGFCEMKINDIGGGGALNARNFERICHKTRKAKSRIAWRIFLIIGVFVRFVDNDETKVMKRGEKGRTGADHDKGLGGL